MTRSVTSAKQNFWKVYDFRSSFENSLSDLLLVEWSTFFQFRKSSILKIPLTLLSKGEWLDPA